MTRSSSRIELAVRSTRRRMLEATQWLSPSMLVPLSESWTPSTVAFVCVYRAKNTNLVAQLIAQLPPGTAVRLWALDQPTEELTRDTVGQGPGGRLDLLNKLIALLPERPDMLVISDDDTRFVAGGLRRLLKAGTLMEFDLFQPTHSAQSKTAFTYARKRRFAFGRESTFVEQGPMIVLSRRAQDRLLPLPEDFGMGWGVEVRWSRVATEHGLRLGVVDAVAIRHLRRFAPTYDTTPELARLQRELSAAGLERVGDLQKTTRRIGPLQAWRKTHIGRHPAGGPADGS